MVLIVEDDADIRSSLEDLLRGHGYRTASAANGQEALDFLGKSSLRPFLILLDLSMPIHGRLGILGAPAERCTAPQRAGRDHERLVGCRRLPGVAYRPGCAILAEDRKSTRLNSS